MATSSRARPSTGHAERQHLNAAGNVAPLGRAAARQLDDWIELLARISHELRTPLNAVIGFSDAMQHEVFGPLGHARYQEYASHIRDSGDLLLRAAEDTLAMTSLLAAPQSVALAELALAPLVEVAVAEIGAAGGTMRHRDRLCGCRRHRGARRRPGAAACVAPYDRRRPGARRAGVAIADRGGGRAGPRQPQRVARAAGRPAGEVRPAPAPLRHERGLGREELPLRLARALMDLHGETVWTEHDGSGWSIRTALNQAVQADFFAVRKG